MLILSPTCCVVLLGWKRLSQSGNLTTDGIGVPGFSQSRSKCLVRMPVLVAEYTIFPLSFLFLNEAEASTSSLSTMSILIFVCKVEY